ncbi:hypothetical protein DH2020_016927 [Rehmannia glutinosa]|uniref:Uncharacterized protein n=1 Tax=Rehmannia glutinosa TaxID=99300 RepID=A0ABR0WPD7_REHGL
MDLKVLHSLSHAKIFLQQHYVISNTFVTKAPISCSSFQLLTHALNKNCLFLICNGLLVFLAKTSGFIRPPPSDNSNNIKRIGNIYGLQMALEAKEPPRLLIENYILEKICDNKEELKEDEKEKSDQRADDVSIIIAESEEEERESDDQCTSCWLFDDGDEEEQLVVYDEEQLVVEDEEKKECLSTQELNQKFEDFIKRMKEDIMIHDEATHKAVVLN